MRHRSRGHTQAREEPCLQHPPEGKNADEDEPIHASVLRAYLYEPHREKWIRSAGRISKSPERYFRERCGITDQEWTSRLEWFRIADAQETAVVLVLCCVPFDQPRLITVEH